MNLAGKPSPREDPWERQQRAILRRREFDRQRTELVFNPKQRIIGIDKQALDHQVAAKRSKDQETRSQDFHLNESVVMLASELQEADEHWQRLRRQRDRKVQSHNLRQMQEANMRRIEEDRAQELLTYESDFTAFQGFDPQSDLRKLEQRRQQRDWITQQLHLQEAKREMEKEQNRRLDLMMEQQQDLAFQNRAEEIRDRYDRNLEIGRQNVDLAERQWRQRNKEKEYEEALKDLELRYQLQSHLLNENDPEQFKGMSPEELAAIYRERRYQVDYRSRQKEDEIDRRAAEARVEEEERRRQVEAEKEFMARRRYERELIKRDQERQIVMSKGRREQWGARDRWTPNADFFAQFNRHHR